MGLLVEGTGYEIVGLDRGNVTNSIHIRCITSVDANDTLTVDLTKYGILATGFIGVVGYTHTVANDEMAQNQPTTAVSLGVLTLTIGTGTDEARFYEVIGFRDKAADSEL